MVIIKSLLQRIKTNLRTIVVFIAVMIRVLATASSQPTLCSFATLAETDTRSAPMGPIRQEYALDVMPAPYGHAELTTAQMAVGFPQYSASLHLGAQGAPGMLKTRVSALKTWTPRQGYRFAAITHGHWDCIDFFPDQWSVAADLAAEFHIAEWRITAGLFDGVALGRRPSTQMLFGLSMIMQQASVHFEIASVWHDMPRFAFSSAFSIQDSIAVLASIQTSPLGLDVAMRLPATDTFHLVLGLRYRERLGIQPRISVCWPWPLQ